MSEAGATIRSPSFDERAAPPPADPPSLPVEPPSLPVNAQEPSPPAGWPAEDLKITSVALDIPAEFREQMARDRAAKVGASFVELVLGTRNVRSQTAV